MNFLSQLNSWLQYTMPVAGNVASGLSISLGKASVKYLLLWEASHNRREFTDTLKALPKDAATSETNAKAGLEVCNKLFKLEREYKKEKLSPEERLKNV